MKIHATELADILDKACKVLEKRLDNYSRSKAFFLELADCINQEIRQGKAIAGGTLYKMYLKLYTNRHGVMGINVNTLNKLCLFAVGKKYQDYANKTDKEQLSEASKRVEADMPADFGEADNPLQAEFPPKNPAFPATPTIPIHVPGFENVWLKDESQNPTGTHKDRLAWEIILYYNPIIKQHYSSPNNLISTMPQPSLITSGCAGIAIQQMFNSYAPFLRLRALVDKRMDERLLKGLQKVGCKVYKTDLSLGRFSSQDILRKTQNESGVDLTFNQGVEAIKNTFYDWLSYEILNQNPKYCFIPYGSGHLYRNILHTLKKETQKAPKRTRRFMGNINRLQHCHFIGATTTNRESVLDKLYSPFPTFEEYNHELKDWSAKGVCGAKSRIHELKEEFVLEALRIADANRVRCEPSGIAGLALLLQMKDRIPKDEKILIC